MARRRMHNAFLDEDADELTAYLSGGVAGGGDAAQRQTAPPQQQQQQQRRKPNVFARNRRPGPRGRQRDPPSAGRPSSSHHGQGQPPASRWLKKTPADASLREGQSASSGAYRAAALPRQGPATLQFGAPSDTHGRGSMDTSSILSDSADASSPGPGLGRNVVAYGSLGRQDTVTAEHIRHVSQRLTDSDGGHISEDSDISTPSSLHEHGSAFRRQRQQHRETLEEEDSISPPSSPLPGRTTTTTKSSAVAAMGSGAGSGARSRGVERKRASGSGSAGGRRNQGAKPQPSTASEPTANPEQPVSLQRGGALPQDEVVSHARIATLDDLSSVSSESSMAASGSGGAQAAGLESDEELKGQHHRTRNAAHPREDARRGDDVGDGGGGGGGGYTDDFEDATSDGILEESIATDVPSSVVPENLSGTSTPRAPSPLPSKRTQQQQQQATGVREERVLDADAFFDEESVASAPTTASHGRPPATGPPSEDGGAVEGSVGSEAAYSSDFESEPRTDKRSAGSEEGIATRSASASRRDASSAQGSQGDASLSRQQGGGAGGVGDTEDDVPTGSEESEAAHRARRRRSTARRRSQQQRRVSGSSDMYTSDITASDEYSTTSARTAGSVRDASKRQRPRHRRHSRERDRRRSSRESQRPRSREHGRSGRGHHRDDDENRAASFRSTAEALRRSMFLPHRLEESLRAPQALTEALVVQTLRQQLDMFKSVTETYRRFAETEVSGCAGRSFAHAAGATREVSSQTSSSKPTKQPHHRTGTATDGDRGYVTLDSTLDYIKRNRKPTLTMEVALKQLQHEEELYGEVLS